jgi:hypothetical protein
MSALCPTLCCVHEPNPDGVPARDPDRLNKWFIGGVVMGVGVNLLSGFVVTHRWAWHPPAVFVAALLVAVPSTGLPWRERYATTRARAMVLLALTGYPGGHAVGIVTGWPLAVMILSPSAMARQQTAFDLGSAWLLDYERRPPALGWSHAAGGGGQVSGPAHPHDIFARLGQGDCQ